jgi:hypothetical protein
MLTQIALIVVLAVLYGLAWHNRPAKEPVKEARREKGA